MAEDAMAPRPAGNSVDLRLSDHSIPWHLGPIRVRARGVLAPLPSCRRSSGNDVCPRTVRNDERRPRPPFVAWDAATCRCCYLRMLVLTDAATSVCPY